MSVLTRRLRGAAAAAAVLVAAAMLPATADVTAGARERGWLAARVMGSDGHRYDLELLAQRSDPLDPAGFAYAYLTCVDCSTRVVLTALVELAEGDLEVADDASAAHLVSTLGPSAVEARWVGTAAGETTVGGVAGGGWHTGAAVMENRAEATAKLWLSDRPCRVSDAYVSVSTFVGAQVPNRVPPGPHDSTAALAVLDGARCA